MGRKIFLAALVTCLVGLAGSVSADTYIYMDPVHLYVWDSPNDDDSSVTIIGSFFAIPSGPTLEYKYGDLPWTAWPSGNQITIDNVSGHQPIDFRVNLGENKYDYNAVVTFVGDGDPYPYFQTANLLWAFQTSPTIEIRFSTATASNLDRLTFVPLPSTVLLLGTGLAGLVMVYYRRRGKRVNL